MGAQEPPSMPMPNQVRLLKDKSILNVVFGEETFSFTAEFLRVHSPSAEVQGHGPGQGVLVSGKKSVTIMQVAPVGNYALKLSFSDGHNTGLYTWQYFKKMGAEQFTLWAAYKEALIKKGLQR